VQNQSMLQKQVRHAKIVEKKHYFDFGEAEKKTLHTWFYHGGIILPWFYLSRTNVDEHLIWRSTKLIFGEHLIWRWHTKLKLSVHLIWR